MTAIRFTPLLFVVPPPPIGSARRHDAQAVGTLDSRTIDQLAEEDTRIAVFTQHAAMKLGLFYERKVQDRLSHRR